MTFPNVHILSAPWFCLFVFCLFLHEELHIDHQRRLCELKKQKQAGWLPSIEPGCRMHWKMSLLQIFLGKSEEVTFSSASCIQALCWAATLPASASSAHTASFGGLCATPRAKTNRKQKGKTKVQRGYGHLGRSLEAKWQAHNSRTEIPTPVSIIHTCHLVDHGHSRMATGK